MVNKGLNVAFVFYFVTEHQQLTNSRTLTVLQFLGVQSVIFLTLMQIYLFLWFLQNVKFVGM